MLCVSYSTYWHGRTTRTIDQLYLDYQAVQEIQPLSSDVLSIFILKGHAAFGSLRASTIDIRDVINSENQ
jgi:hypothetical protein